MTVKTPRTIPFPGPGLRRWGRRLAEALLPRHCILCGLASGQANLCPPCREDLPRGPDTCTACALPLAFAERGVCGPCRSDPPPWDRAYAALLYEFPVDRLVCRFKFNRNLACGAVLATELVVAVEEQCTELPDLLVPVPLHRTRQFRRLFNQADILARAVGRNTGIPVSSLGLRRRRRTRAQSGLDADTRRRNTRDAFMLNQAKRATEVSGQHVGLVDDVMTTGATLEACTHVLKDAGAREVSVWVAARAPEP